MKFKSSWALIWLNYIWMLKIPNHLLINHNYQFDMSGKNHQKKKSPIISADIKYIVVVVVVHVKFFSVKLCGWILSNKASKQILQSKYARFHSKWNEMNEPTRRNLRRMNCFKYWNFDFYFSLCSVYNNKNKNWKQKQQQAIANGSCHNSFAIQFSTPAICSFEQYVCS